MVINSALDSHDIQAQKSMYFRTKPYRLPLFGSHRTRPNGKVENYLWCVTLCFARCKSFT